jgi:hypothetical protein
MKQKQQLLAEVVSISHPFFTKYCNSYVFYVFNQKITPPSARLWNTQPTDTTFWCQNKVPIYHSQHKQQPQVQVEKPAPSPFLHFIFAANILFFNSIVLPPSVALEKSQPTGTTRW